MKLDHRSELAIFRVFWTTELARSANPATRDHPPELYPFIYMTRPGLRTMASSVLKTFFVSLMIMLINGYQTSILTRRNTGFKLAMHLSPTARPNLSGDAGNSNFVEGTCKWFDSSKGFGFVRYKSDDIFSPPRRSTVCSHRRLSLVQNYHLSSLRTSRAGSVHQK